MIHNQNGKSLVDLIVGITVGAIIVAGAFQLHNVFIKGNKAVKNESVLQEHLARANQVLEKDIRMAGFNVPGNGLVVDQSVTGAHVLRLLINEENYITTLSVAAAPTDVKLFVADASDASVGMWVALYEDDDIAYYEISHVGIRVGGPDTITVFNALTDDWAAGDTEIYIATCYKYSLEMSGSVKSLVRRTYSDSYTISEEIDGMTVTAKEADGTPVTVNFLDARSVSVQLDSQIEDVNSNEKTVTNKVEAAIRNPS